MFKKRIRWRVCRLRPAFLAERLAVERQMQNVLVEISTWPARSPPTGHAPTKLELLIKEADQKIAALGSRTPPAHPPPSRRKPPKSNLPPDPRHANIYSLADQGRSPSEIARQLNRPSGEIELILALRQ